MTLSLTHRRYVDFSRAHYAGNLVDGAYVLGLFGDIATDICLHHDGDEGLFAGYSTVTFHQPVRAGDVIEVTATLTRVGTRSRLIDFTAHVVTRSFADGTTRGQILPEPILAVSAAGTVVVPAAEDRP
jgi:3-aminobutyryl-CoA ammonia-lyase